MLFATQGLLAALTYQFFCASVMLGHDASQKVPSWLLSSKCHMYTARHGTLARDMGTHMRGYAASSPRVPAVLSYNAAGRMPVVCFCVCVCMLCVCVSCSCLLVCGSSLQSLALVRTDMHSPTHASFTCCSTQAVACNQSRTSCMSLP